MDKQVFLNRFFFHNQPISTDLRAAEKSLLINNHSLKKAAVLIPFVKRANGLNIIFTERALHLRHHPGQISFPGGKQEQGDSSLKQTALRETEEEIGILQDQIAIFGTLPKLPTVSGFVVYPYLGFVQSNHTLQIDEQEVKSIFEVPLTFVLNKKNYYLQHLTANKKRHFTYCIPYQNRMIWGATAQMLYNLQRHLND
ncbi:MAG: 8-oxo-dGTP pyrophosphatase MutT (NUDIX family) [Psychromonas sp.]|jgi:8-oxo-dGTP pyrophosphatase MutT (NUDIX family)|uniref:CoA pyrophosphatase n=1 Tax=Psychromonas sp. TaxID=1884585 RepID=UPI0039E68217